MLLILVLLTLLLLPLRLLLLMMLLVSHVLHVHLIVIGHMTLVIVTIIFQFVIRSMKILGNFSGHSLRILVHALARRRTDQLERLLLGCCCSVRGQLLLLHWVAALLLRLVIGFSDQNPHLVRHLAIASILLYNSSSQATRDRDSLLQEALL